MTDRPGQGGGEVVGAKGQVTVREPTSAQRSVARRAAEARATIPELEVSVEADMEPALERCQTHGCSLDAALMDACAAALRSVPAANGAYRDGRFETYARVNVGFVVAGDDSYVVPTVFDADRRSLSELSVEIERVGRAAREGALSPAAFSGATFTLWNAGALGVMRAGIILNPPQAGALAVGEVRDVPVVRAGGLCPGKNAVLTLACDHRILYGALAAAFLSAVKDALESDADGRAL